MFKKPSKKMLDVIIFCSVSLSVLLLLHLFLGRTVIRYANRLKEEFKLREAKLRESENLIKSLPDPQKAIEEIERKAEEFKDMGISIKQFPRLIQLLGRSAAEHNINVISIKPREDIKAVNEVLPTGVTKVYIELVISSSYQLIGDYIKILSTLPISFSIESMDIEKKEPALESLETKKTTETKTQEELICSLLLSTYTIWEL